jgi:hypothetical protein
MGKVFTVRLSDEQVAELTKLSTFDGVAIAEEIREAISMLLKSRPRDPEFVRRVREHYENAGTVLAKLERGHEVIDALGNPLESTMVELAGTTRAAAAAAAAEGAPSALKRTTPARKGSVSAARARSHR